METRTFYRDKKRLVLTISGAVLLLCGLLLGLLEVPLHLRTREFGPGARLLPGEGRFTVLLCADAQAQDSKLQSVKEFLHRAGGDLLLLEGDEIQTQESLRLLLQENPTALEHPFLLLGYGKLAPLASRLQIQLANSGSFGMDKVAGLVLFSPLLSPTEEIVLSDAPILILGTSSDTAPTPALLTELYNRLSGDTIKPTGLAFQAERNNCRLEVVSGVVDAYQGYSREILNALADWCADKLPLAGEMTTQGNTLRLFCWFGVIFSLAGLLISGYGLAEEHMIDLAYSVVPLQVKNRQKFLAAKMLVWILSLPILGILLLLFWMLPLELPIWALTFCGYLFSCGAVTALLYRKGWMPGVNGTLSPLQLPHSPRRTLLGLCVVILTALCLWGLGLSGLFSLRPTREMSLWFFLFTAMSGVAFYFLFMEGLLLSQAKFRPATQLITSTIPLLPLAALLVFSLPAAGFTVTLTLFFYLSLLILLLLLGRLVQLLSGKPVLAAGCCALLLGGFMAFGHI